MLSALSWFSLQHDDDPGWCILDPVHRRCTQQMHKMMQICISVSRCISILASQIGLTRTNEPTPVTKQKPNTKFLFLGFWRINCNLSLQSNPTPNLPNQSSSGESCLVGDFTSLEPIIKHPEAFNWVSLNFATACCPKLAVGCQRQLCGGNADKIRVHTSRPPSRPPLADIAANL